MSTLDKPVFWRDSRMPYVELRHIADGRNVGYALHSHAQWSLGAITEGQSTFLYRDKPYMVTQGDLVMMNPHWPHACNPLANQAWSYFMLYVDREWLTQLRIAVGALDNADNWQDIDTAVLSDSLFFDDFCQMATCLLDPDRALLDKQTHVVSLLSELMQSLASSQQKIELEAPTMMQVVADYLDQHCAEDISLDELCALSGYSPSHFIRRFRQYFGMTPHAYLVNQRIQFSQRQLKQGATIAETALNAGFADQAHFQRTFKRLVAATPHQYRQSLSKY